jgi:MOSC domain-containing protein YiiM
MATLSSRQDIPKTGGASSHEADQVRKRYHISSQGRLSRERGGAPALPVGAKASRFAGGPSSAHDPEANMPATIAAIHLSKASRAPLVSVPRVNAVLEIGLEGDRHAKPKSRRQVLLVEGEVLDEFGLVPGAIREQVTVRGLDLGKLVFGARLRVGGAVLEVAGPCHPCERMDEVKPGLKQALVGRRGRFVRVVEAGSFAVGDAIQLEPPASP